MKKNVIAAFEDMNASVKFCVSPIVSESNCRRERANVVCTKPRRIGLINTCGIDPIRPFRWPVSYQQEVETKAGADQLLDSNVPKGSCGECFVHIASSPPYFCGSPPSRVSNPVIRDTRFGDERAAPVSPRVLLIPSGSTVSARNGGSSCVRANFGNNPAVRIEGFECDRRNRSIPALV